MFSLPLVLPFSSYAFPSCDHLLLALFLALVWGDLPRPSILCHLDAGNILVCKFLSIRCATFYREKLWLYPVLQSSHFPKENLVLNFCIILIVSSVTISWTPKTAWIKINNISQYH